MTNIKKINQQGMAHLGLIVVLLFVVAAVGFTGYRVFSKQSNSDIKSVNDGSGENPASDEQGSGGVAWQWDGSKWVSSGNPPACKDPVQFSVSPVDISKASAILYPGQSRGGNYKPHGGFRLDGTSNNIEVKAIMDGKVTSGSRYIEAGEVQYMFTITNDCGIAYRYDHLLVLSPEFEKLADKLPAAKENDSRTTNFSDAVLVKAGDTVATAVGFKKTSNYSFDLGVYDYRKQNQAASSQSYLSEHKDSLSQAAYAQCWLNMFASDVNQKLNALPAGDQQQGKNSDYCK